MAMKNIPTVNITVNNIISSTGILTPQFTETKEQNAKIYVDVQNWRAFYVTLAILCMTRN